MAPETEQGGPAGYAAGQGIHGAVPQQVHVIDRVCPGRHARDQARDFHVRAGPALAAGPDVLRGQLAKPGALCQGHHRTRPACDTRFGSPDNARIFARLCTNRTY